MVITLYKNTSARNVLSKTLTAIATYNNAEIKNPCSVMDPVIILPFYSDNTYDTFDVNYMEIATFNRKYFINKIEVEHQRIIIYAHVDVLSTYSTEILKMSAMIERAENNNAYNLYLNDRAFKSYAYRITSTRAWDKSFTKNLNFVLTVAGGA